MLNKTLIVCAVPEELEGLDGDFNIVYTGIGLENARAALEKVLETKTSDELSGLTVVNVGTCGSQRFPRGALLGITKATGRDGGEYKEFNLTEWNTKLIDYFQAVCYSAATFVSPETEAINSELALLHPDCVDMEVVVQAEVCQKYNVCFRSLKVVSDQMDGTFDDWKKSVAKVRPFLIHAIKVLHSNNIL